MKAIWSLIVSAALASSAFAGTTYDAKAPKNPVVPPSPLGCECFQPGFAIGVYGSGIFFDGGDDEWGGGALAEYFFTPNIGVQGSYGLYSTDKEHHEMDAAVVVRFPITSICIAPYILGGGGFSTNSDDNWNVFVGGGLEARFAGAGCLGVFVDGAYHWVVDGDGADYTIVRAGIKFPF